MRQDLGRKTKMGIFQRALLKVVLTGASLKLEIATAEIREKYLQSMTQW